VTYLRHDVLRAGHTCLSYTYAGVKWRASNRRITADNAIDYAYRDLGLSEVPLVLLQHFRGNLDNWDPALIDALTADRRLVAFDNIGVAGTSGTTPNTIEAMAMARSASSRR
jgi:pimeloyl-ACP methyl ester carboxylesterase